MRLFSLWREKLSKMRTVQKLKYLPLYNNYNKEFDKITTFAQLRKQYCDKKFEIELLLCVKNSKNLTQSRIF